MILQRNVRGGERMQRGKNLVIAKRMKFVLKDQGKCLSFASGGQEQEEESQKDISEGVTR